MMMNGITGRTRERLVRKQLGKQLQGTQSHEPPDVLHNLGIPPCRLLVEAVTDIIPESSTTTAPEEPSILGRMTRRHLERKTTLKKTEEITVSTTSKKKKKRKKKKKTATGEGKVDATLLLQVEKSSSKESEAESHHQELPPPPAQEVHESSAPPPSLAILQDWLQHASSSATDSAALVQNRDLESFLQHISKLDGIQLNVNAARQAVDAIACDACKQVATSYFWSSLKDYIQLDPFYMELPSKQSSHHLNIPGMPESVEHAFDYFAMEEGHTDENHALLTFVYTEPYIQSNESLTLEQFGILLEDMILKPGLPERPSEDAGLHHVLEDSVTSIIKEIKQSEQELRNRFTGIERGHATLLAELENSIMVEPFDVKTSTAFFQYDDKLDTTLQALVEIVRNVSKQHYRSSYRLRDTQLLEHIQDMYSWVAQTISPILQAQLAHAGRLVHLAARPGAVPPMAVNAQHRDSYRSLLMHKLSVLQELRRSLSTILFDKYVFRTILAHSRMDAMAQTVALPSPLATDGYDDFWTAALEMTHTIKAGTVDQIQDKHVANAQAWLRTVESHSNVEAASHLKNAHERALQEAQRLQAVVLGSDDDEDAKQEAVPQFAVAVFDVFYQVLNQILHVMKTTQVVSYDGGTVSMPPNLLAFSKGEDHHGGPCQGGGGRRRATGIVVGLLYQWLKDRCNEWHAELTQNELLESMMFDEQPVDDNFKPAKSKKSKKKREREKKNALATTAAASERVPSLNDAVDDNTGTAVDNNKGTDNALEASNATLAEATAKLNSSTSSDALNHAADVVGSSGAVHKSAKKLDGARDTVDNGDEAADTWSDWRANLSETGLLDENASPKSTVEEFKVAKSKKSKRKLAEKSGEKLEAHAASSSDQVTANVGSSRPATASHGVQSTDTSKEKGGHDSSAFVLANDKTKKENRVGSLRNAADSGSNAKPGETLKENGDRSHSSNKTEEKKKDSGDSKSSAARTCKNGKAPSTSTEQGAKAKEKGSRAQTDSKQPQKTAERNTKERGSQKKTSPLKRTGPSPPDVEVGVVSATGFQSAEGFLVGRLMAALRAEGETTTKKKMSSEKLAPREHESERRLNRRRYV